MGVKYPLQAGCRGILLYSQNGKQELGKKFSKFLWLFLSVARLLYQSEHLSLLTITITPADEKLFLLNHVLVKAIIHHQNGHYVARTFTLFLPKLTDLFT
jgi:hypothetical protein